jgi:hypothetical protein
MLHDAYSLDHIGNTYKLTLIALVLMFSIAMQYYDTCHCEWYEHALTKSALAGIMWIWLHPAMTFFMFFIGSTLKVFYFYVSDGQIGGEHRLLMDSSVFIMGGDTSYGSGDDHSDDHSDDHASARKPVLYMVLFSVCHGLLTLV